MGHNLHKCVIGLIGGIGSGKSQVAAEFQRRGARIIDADRLGHEALKQSAIKERLIERWGRDVCDDQGEINRRKVGQIVFADSVERRALEAEVFPYIEQRMDEQIAAAQADSTVRFVVLDAAILLETGWGARCDAVVYVHTPYRQRWQRLTQQRGWNEKEVQQRSESQWSLTDKITRSDFVVDNSGSIEALSRQIDRLLARVNWTACDKTVSS